MKPKDKIDDLLMKFAGEIMDEVPSPKTACLDDDFLWKYVHEESTAQEKEQIEQHLIACDKCLETLEYMRMTQQAELEPEQIPEKLYRNAQEILQKELKKNALAPKKTSIPPLKVTFLWDKLHNKVSQLTANLEKMLDMTGPEFQAVRKKGDLAKELRGFPYKTTIQGNKGKIVLEIDSSRLEKCLSLKIFFDFVSPENPIDVRATLTKANRIYSSVYLNHKGEAFFPRIDEGGYTLELFAENKSLEKVELSLQSMK